MITNGRRAGSSRIIHEEVTSLMSRSNDMDKTDIDKSDTGKTDTDKSDTDKTDTDDSGQKMSHRGSRPSSVSADGTSGRHRRNLRPGLEVEIVLKRDQATGKLTRGRVQQLLTNSATHPHGIKVRLTDGSVGRVKRIVTEPERT